MSPDTGVAPGPSDDDAEVMASLDENGAEQRLVIADISADEEWVSMAARDAVPLATMR